MALVTLFSYKCGEEPWTDERTGRRQVVVFTCDLVEKLIATLKVQCYETYDHKQQEMHTEF
jgi:hypothetical protein